MRNPRVKKQQSGWRLLFHLLRVRIVKLIKGGPGVPIKIIRMERGRLLVVQEDRISSVTYSEDVQLIRDLEAWVIKVCNVNHHLHWSFYV